MNHVIVNTYGSFIKCFHFNHVLSTATSNGEPEFLMQLTLSPFVKTFPRIIQDPRFTFTRPFLTNPFTISLCL